MRVNSYRCELHSYKCEFNWGKIAKLPGYQSANKFSQNWSDGGCQNVRSRRFAAARVYDC